MKALLTIVLLIVVIGAVAYLYTGASENENLPESLSELEDSARDNYQDLTGETPEQTAEDIQNAVREGYDETAAAVNDAFDGNDEDENAGTNAATEEQLAAQNSETAPEAEPIKAEIINDDPSAFTIDVEFLDNMDAETDAQYFAVYVSDDKPANCADFSDTELSYSKPEEHKRRFDLSAHQDILDAIETQRCVIIPNIPAGE